MTTLTILTGETFGSAIAPANSYNWGDLGSAPYASWSNWNSWRITTGSSVSVQLDDDLGSVDYRMPYIEILQQGDVAVTLKISSTGAFTGEETTINFAFETPVTFVNGRYYRWTITVTANSEFDQPLLLDYRTIYETDLYLETLEDVDVFASSTTSLTTNLGLIRNIQATALRGDPYVLDGYIQTAAENVFRTPVTLNTIGMAVTSTINAVNKFANTSVIDFGFADAAPSIAQIDFDDQYAFPQINSGDWTVETHFRTRRINADWALLAQYDANNNRAGNQNLGLVYSNSTGAIQFFGGLSGSEFAITTPNSAVSIDTWHHVAVVRSGSNIYLYFDGNRVDSDTYSNTEIEDNQPLIIGGIDTTGDGIADSNDFDGYISNYRISSAARYTDTTYTVPAISFSNDANTTLLLKDALADEAGYNDGGDEYIIEQRGGSPVIKSKNPPQVQVVDYNGDAWDGTVDVVLRGYPKIQLTTGGVFPLAV